MTFCSDDEYHISFTFEHFNTEAGNDELSIYDGSSTGADLMGTYSGFGKSNSPGVVTSTETVSYTHLTLPTILPTIYSV